MGCAGERVRVKDPQITVIVLVGFIVLVVGFILYIRALVNAANSDRWGWVILMLVVWPLFIFYRSKPREEDYRREPRADRREPTMGGEQ